jgi:hypothetical protein
MKPPSSDSSAPSCTTCTTVSDRRYLSEASMAQLGTASKTEVRAVIPAAP